MSSAHVPPSLPAYLERELAASLEKLGIAADSEEGFLARETAFARHQNKLKAARLRRANRKAAITTAAESVVETETDEKKDSLSSASVTLSPTKKPRRVKGSPKWPEAPEDFSELTSKLATPSSCLTCGARKEKASSQDTSLNTE